MVREIDVGPEGPVRNHDSFREARSAGGVIDHCEFVRLVLVIIEVFLFEVVRIFLAETLVKMLPYLLELLGPGVIELEVVDLDDNFQTWHLLDAQVLPDGLVGEKDLRFRMVHEEMDIAWFEFMEKGHRYGSVGQSGQEGHSPVRLVLAADGDFISPLKTTLLESDVKLCDSSCHIPVEESDALVIRQCRKVLKLFSSILFTDWKSILPTFQV